MRGFVYIYALACVTCCSYAFLSMRYGEPFFHTIMDKIVSLFLLPHVLLSAPFLSIIFYIKGDYPEWSTYMWEMWQIVQAAFLYQFSQ